MSDCLYRFVQAYHPKSRSHHSDLDSQDHPARQHRGIAQQLTLNNEAPAGNSNFTNARIGQNGADILPP